MSNTHPSTRNMQKVKADKKAEWQAEDAPCWICGQQTIDWDAPHDDYGNESRFEYDHYYPASTHPEFYEDPANGRPSHAGCNRERSNKAPNPSLGSLSREWV